MIKNYSELVNKIKKCTIEDNERLGSFDIKSYFSNVPILGALNVFGWINKI